MNARTPGLALLGPAALALLLPAPVPAGAQVTGDLRVHDLESRIFANTRKIRVWLPPGYDRPTNADRTYPVLYLNDGQNLFDPATAVFGPHEWGADETATRLVEEGEIRALVVVGIDNAGRRGRAREYLPWPDASLEPPLPDPEGQRYDDFLATEVLPFVEARYRVASEPDGRALGGSSYGALAALHAALERPGLFSALLLESPSFYVGGERIFRESDPAELRVGRVYLGVGTNEMGLEGCPESHEVNAEAVAGVRRAADLFRAAGLHRDHDLKVVIEPCAEHGEEAWAGRLPGALAFLFGS